MPLVERYILKIALTAFLVCLLGLTAVIWITQALRELDLMTGQGANPGDSSCWSRHCRYPRSSRSSHRSRWFIAAIYTLNKLNGDSELIVMSGCGHVPAQG